MASEDVIELGSSDDEAEPAPKRKKPALNAMVHFPNKMPGMSIKAAKPTLPPLQKVLAGGAITIKNLKTGKQPLQGSKVKPMAKLPQKVNQRMPQKLPVIRQVSKPVMVSNNLSINPLSFMKNHRAQAPKINLPPGITVKRTAAGQQISTELVVNRKQKQNIRRKPPEKIITTVELDDEVVPVTSRASPQWYLRPEEQTDESIKEDEEDLKECDYKSESETMEAENNREPDTNKMIEITIEDSPIKPVQSKRAQEMGSDLAITIEDSPMKLPKEQKSISGSDNEESSAISPQSKKKLEYQNSEEDIVAEKETENIVEIDLEKSKGAEETASKEESNDKEEKPSEVKNEKKETIETNEPKRDQLVMISKEVDKPEEPESVSTSGEFHPIYQKFIDLCLKLEDSDDMKKIVEKKIKTYYRQCPKEYVESEEFTDMVSSKIYATKAAPDKMYLYIKDIVDELNLQRKAAKAVAVSNKENKRAENDNIFCADTKEYDSKRARQIRKLEKTIKKIHRAIQKLEEQEVEFEDEEDSVYLLTERYKERLVRVYAKFCQLSNTKMPSEPRIHIEVRPGRPTGPAKRLEKWVNRKVPIGTPLPFPDFHDVLRCVRDANDEDRLGWNEADIMEEARDLFTRCGKKLQRRRQENEWRIAASRITHDVSTADPAENSEVLKKKLDENKTVAAKKEIELLNKYADKQNQLKLVGEEIGDKEAEESPVESEDEEADDDGNSLENKQKRKNRLRRLLHEKTRKLSAEKENIASNDLKNSKENEEKKDSIAEEEKKVGEDITNLEVKENVKVEEREGTIKAVETKFSSAETPNSEVPSTEIPKTDISSPELPGTEVTNTTVPENGSADSGPAENEPNKVVKAENNKDYETYEVDSDIDELHLLQKLYSENEINSSPESDDSDTPIAISDTLESDSETETNKRQKDDDIISIENSSYSESEMEKQDRIKENESVSIKKEKVDNLLLENVELELSSSRKEIKKSTEYVLLASSDEENVKDTTTVSSDSDKIAKGKTKIKQSGKAPLDNVIDEVILDDDENSDTNNMLAEDTDINEYNDKNTDNNIGNTILNDENELIMEEDNQEVQTESREDEVATIVIEKDDNNPEVIDTKSNDSANEENCHKETDRIADEVESQTYENNCDDDFMTEEAYEEENNIENEMYPNNEGTNNVVTLTEEDNIEDINVDNVMSIENEESHNIARNEDNVESYEGNLETKEPLQRVNELDENNGSPLNSINSIQTEKDESEGGIAEDNNMDVSEVETSESVKDLPSNAHEDCEVMSM